MAAIRPLGLLARSLRRTPIAVARVRPSLARCLQTDSARVGGPQRFTDRVVMVTGGSSGLGADTSELFLKEGAKVFVTDVQERNILERLGPSAQFHFCDVSDAKSCTTAVEACISKFGKLDVLFHNAAKLGPLSRAVDLSNEEFQDVINTDLCGAFYLAKAVIPQMRQQGKGVIINTASTSAFGADSGMVAYNAAKGGILNLTRALAADVAREGIRVVSVCPGFMLTPLTQEVVKRNGLKDAIHESIPMGRGGDPKEVGEVVLFLASDAASYITGHPIMVDGGWNVRNPSPDYYKFYHGQK